MSLILFEYLFLIYGMVVPTRGKTFRRSHMRQFDEVHKEQIGDDKAPAFGYPDTGSGYFGRQLPYE